MDLIGDNVDYLAKMLTVSQKRHSIIAGNLANVNTPHYRAKRLDFEDAFRTALRRGSDDALNVDGKIVTDEDATVKSDGNSVHLEQELGRVQQNQILFEVYSSLLKEQLGHVKLAITGGR